MDFIVKYTQYTIIYYTICGKFIIQYVSFLLYNLCRFCYTICGFTCYGSASCLIERQIEVPKL